MILALTAMVSCGAEQKDPNEVTVAGAEQEGSTYDIPSDEASVFSSEELGVRVEIPAGAVEEGTQLNIREAAGMGLVNEDQEWPKIAVTLSTTKPLLKAISISLSIAPIMDAIREIRELKAIALSLADDGFGNDLPEHTVCEDKWMKMKANCEFNSEDPMACEEEWMEAKAACDAIAPEEEGDGIAFFIAHTNEDGKPTLYEGEDVTWNNEELTISTMELGTFTAGITVESEDVVISSENPDDGTDTDDDGISDFEEVNFYDTDPNNPDTDGDGKTDGEELESGELYPILSYGVPVGELNNEEEPQEPQEPQGEDRDTDGDGVSDEDEMANDTNPQDASSF